MSLRILIMLECNRCHHLFDRRLLDSRTLHGDLSDEVHELVVAAEEDQWESKRNATEHYCARCVEPF